MKAPMIILAIVVIAVIAILYYFLVYAPAHAASNATEGAPCKVNLLPGTIKNGQCIANPPTAAELPCGGKLNPC